MIRHGVQMKDSLPDSEELDAIFDTQSTLHNERAKLRVLIDLARKNGFSFILKKGGLDGHKCRCFDASRS